jgi:hypothetical protein
VSKSDVGRISATHTNTTGSRQSDILFTEGATLQFQVGTILGNGGYDDQNWVRGVANIPLTFFTNSTERMRITSGGNVGIGTTSPSAKLVISNNGGTGYEIDPANASGTIVSLFSYDRAASLWRATRYSGLDHRFEINGTTEAMRITSGGNVGIGTTSPYGRLELNGSGQSWTTAPAIRMWDSFNSKGWLVGNVNNYTPGDFYIRTLPSVSGDPGAGQQEFIIKHATGNVGIGTASPSELLEVVGNIRANISNGGGFMLTGASASGLVRAGATGLALRTNTTDRLTVDNNGNVGIGTTSPSAELQVEGAIKITGGNWPTGYAGLEFNYITNTSYIGSYDRTNSIYKKLFLFSEDLTLETGGAIRMFITSGGNIGIGTTSPSYKLHVEGNVSGISIYASHDIAAFSDITVKKEVKRIENAIEKVKELNGYTYVRTDDETGTRRAGVIAQEVQKVLPEVVSANPDGTLNVAYSNMIALLIEAVKEQQNEIDELKKLLKK